MTPIAGETNQDFTPGGDGDYAVIITDGTCVDTSACMTVDGVGLGDDHQKHFAIYPNPANEQVFVDLTGISGEVMLELVSADGKICISRHLASGDLEVISLTSLAPGIYSLRIGNAAIGVQTELFVKQ
jgi:hypothetical protein